MQPETESIGVSPASMHSTAAQLQIYTQINNVWFDSLLLHTQEV